MSEEMRGTVKWFNANRGYGFIADESGIDYFVHYTEIQMEGFRRLKSGQTVSFVHGEDQQGRPVALSVLVVSD